MPRPFHLTPPRPPRLSENHVEKACLDVLAAHGYWVTRNHAGTFKSIDNRRFIHGVPKGTPDYSCLHGTHRNFLLEVKRPGAELSPDQRAKIDEIDWAFHIPVAVVDTVDALIVWLSGHERSP